jgi:hypothetical protein
MVGGSDARNQQEEPIRRCSVLCKEVPLRKGPIRVQERNAASTIHEQVSKEDGRT